MKDQKVDVWEIPLMANTEDTFEYWCYEASKGRNVAVCWQNCNRIMNDFIKANFIAKSEVKETVSEIVNQINEEATFCIKPECKEVLLKCLDSLE
jgi:hypothetical protein